MKTASIALASALFLTACSKTGSSPAKPAEESSTLISMEPVAQQNVGLKIAPVGRVQLTEHLQVIGTVQPVDSRVAQVRSLARARLLEVLVKVGERVQAGQELARIDNLEAGELTAQLSQARAELQRLRVLLGAQARQVERNRKLSEIGAAPTKDLEQARADYQAMEENIRAQESLIAGLAARLKRLGWTESDPSIPPVTSIRAPLGGIVLKTLTAPGAVIDPGTELFTVADISRVWVQAEVYEKDLGRIQVGQAARIFVDTYPEQPFAGKVTYISDALDPQTRTAKVRCEVPNDDVRLKLDMFATVQLPTTFSRLVIAVPESAVQQLDGKTVVFVQRAAAGFEPRQVQLGRTVNGHVEVLGGLREGENIVTMGSFHLKSIVAGKTLGEE